MRLADTHPEPGFPISPVRSGIDPKPTLSFSGSSANSPLRQAGQAQASDEEFENFRCRKVSALAQVGDGQFGVDALTTPLIYQTGPKTSAKSGWSCSMLEKRCISGRSLPSGIMGIRS